MIVSRYPWEWEKILDIRIMDADGWGNDVPGYPARDWREKLTEEEFEARAALSTVQIRIEQSPPPQHPVC